MRFYQRADSNWTPLLVVMTEGIPNLETQPLRNACPAVSAVLSGSGMASGHSLKQSMHISIKNLEITIRDPLNPHVHG